MNAPNRLHNNPPDPLDEALAPYSDHITEAEAWLDGAAVTDEGQMKAVDALLKQIKAAHSATAAAQKSEAAPLHDAWKAALARYKPTLDDLDRMKKGLAALVDGFKRALAEERAAAERKARAEAEAARRAAEEKARAADAANIEAQREAAQAQAEADRMAAEAARASRAAKDVKGLRTETLHEITDHKAALHWIAQNDREAMTAFIVEYVRRNHRSAQIDGVRVWTEKRAF